MTYRGLFIWTPDLAQSPKSILVWRLWGLDEHLYGVF